MDGSRSQIRLLYTARGIRGFGDGFAIIVLPAYLTAIGYGPIEVGIIATASLLGTALFTLGIGLIAPRHDLRTLLLLGAGLMALTGLAFPNFEHFVLVVLVAFVGTINPATGDLGILVPLEAPDVAAAASLTVHEQARMEQFRKDSFVGTGPEVATRIRDLATEVGAQEMAVVTWTHDEEVRRESYTHLARAFDLKG